MYLTLILNTVLLSHNYYIVSANIRAIYILGITLCNVNMSVCRQIIVACCIYMYDESQLIDKYNIIYMKGKIH